MIFRRSDTINMRILKINQLVKEKEIWFDVYCVFRVNMDSHITCSDNSSYILKMLSAA